MADIGPKGPQGWAEPRRCHRTVMVIIVEAHFPIRIISLIRTESSTHQADPRSHPQGFSIVDSNRHEVTGQTASSSQERCPHREV